MRKLIVAAAIALSCAFANAATVGWSLGGLSSFAGDSYAFFVIGQNGADSIATITALLDAGDSSYASKAFGTGMVAANGSATVAAGSSGKTIADAGTYTGFFVLFDSATPEAGSSQYVVISGASTLTKTLTATTATVTFAGGNGSTIAGDASNWAAYGTAIPEPTSGLLMLVGLGALALRRRRA